MRYRVIRNNVLIINTDDADVADKVMDAFFAELGNKMETQTDTEEKIIFFDTEDGIKLTASFSVEHTKKEQQ